MLNNLTFLYRYFHNKKIALIRAIAVTSIRVRIKNLLDCVTLKSQKA